MTSTSNIIKRLRKLGLSQADISMQTGIPQPRLSRWEAGRAPIAAEDSLKLLALARKMQLKGTTK